jgi:hypothetical protein
VETSENTVARLRCDCQRVRAHVIDASASNVNRMICYCDDCQSYLHYLKRADLLDENAGTDVVQVAPARLRFDQGTEQIACVRLSPKGLFRWYARCCHTPLGNTMAPNIPFVGIVSRAFENPDQAFGAPTGGAQAKYAVGTPPPAFATLKLGVVLGALGKVVAWRLGGKVWPHPYFEDRSRTPRYPVHVISKAERDELRALCGPKPLAASR